MRVCGSGKRGCVRVRGERRRGGWRRRGEAVRELPNLLNFQSVSIDVIFHYFANNSANVLGGKTEIRAYNDYKLKEKSWVKIVLGQAGGSRRGVIWVRLG